MILRVAIPLMLLPLLALALPLLFALAWVQEAMGDRAAAGRGVAGGPSAGSAMVGEIDAE